MASTILKSNRFLNGVLKSITRRQLRWLSLHEYQSQGLLKEFGVSVPKGQLARSPDEVCRIVEELGGKCVIKSQILKGGRGKGTFDNGLEGGIQLVENPSTGKAVAKQMLGHRLKTKQTTGNGLLVDKVYVAEVLQYDSEWYLAIAIDRENYSPAVIISKSGGMDIETVARETPDKVFKYRFNVSEGITPDLLAQISQDMGTSPGEMASLGDLLARMQKLFVSKDATLMEINPLVRHADTESFTCLDAKFSFDNDAKFRQEELFSTRDKGSGNGVTTAAELEAEQHGLVYIQMTGSIGNVVNGAGLAMATNDAIAHYGGSSANFLDAGGQATKETMQKAFEIILKDDKVKCILVNIYGGIIRCDMIAESIIGAAKEIGSFPVPVVVRLQGTKSEQGLRLLEEAKLGIHTEVGFGDAAKKAVDLACP